MEKISKAFFGNEIVICGCTKADNLYYKRLYKAFNSNGVKVYALPTTPESDLGFETYPDLASLPHVPECAYILSDKEDEAAIVEELKKYGVKRILFYNNSLADDAVVADCERNGIEVRCGCPLLLYNGGPCYLHALIAGVSNER